MPKLNAIAGREKKISPPLVFRQALIENLRGIVAGFRVARPLFPAFYPQVWGISADLTLTPFSYIVQW